MTWPLPDGRVDSGAVSADGTGAVTFGYQLGLDAMEDEYSVDVLDASGNVLATTTFWDSHFRFSHITWRLRPDIAYYR